MDVTIRQAQHHDERALIALDMATWSADTTPTPQVLHPQPFFTPQRQPEQVFVAMDGDDELLGYVMVGPGYELPSHEHVGFIRGLAVDPDSQGRGVARQLLQHAIGELGRHGVRRVRSHVLATNPASLAVHARVGFVEEGRLRGEFRIPGLGPVDDVLLAFTFDDPPAP